MKSIYTTLIVLFSLFAGCSEDIVVPNNYAIQELFPLQVGNNWKYLRNEYGITGTVISSDTNFFYVDSATSYKGKSAFAINGVMAYLYSDNDLVYYYTYDTINVSPSLIIRYPMGLDETILAANSVTSDGYQQSRTVRLVSKDTIVTVPAGTFNCFFYETLHMQGKIGALDTDWVYHHFYAIGVGKVRSNHYLYKNNGSKKPYMFEELHSYTVK